MGELIITLLQILHRVGHCENRSLFGEGMDKSLQLTFGPPCRIYRLISGCQVPTLIQWMSGFNFLFTVRCT